jgi:hypothetical protein
MMPNTGLINQLIAEAAGINTKQVPHLVSGLNVLLSSMVTMGGN